MIFWGLWDPGTSHTRTVSSEFRMQRSDAIGRTARYKEVARLTAETIARLEECAAVAARRASVGYNKQLVAIPLSFVLKREHTLFCPLHNLLHTEILRFQ